MFGYDRTGASRHPSAMIHHEGTKGTRGTKERALVVSQAIIGAAIEVHRQPGPGLLESVYEVSYKGAELESQIRLDLLVESVVVVEIKAADRLAPVHWAQLRTYLKLTGNPVGLLFNFNVKPQTRHATDPQWMRRASCLSCLRGVCVTGAPLDPDRCSPT